MTARFASASWVERSLRALGGEATLGDLLILTGLPSPEVEASLQHLMALDQGAVRVYERGDVTYRLRDVPVPAWNDRRRAMAGAIGFDHKTLRLIRARRGVLSLAELVEHTGFSLRDAEREMQYLEKAYGGERVRSLDDHVVWVFPTLMTTVQGLFADREPKPAWVRARAPLRRPASGHTLPELGFFTRLGLHVRAAWSRRPFHGPTRSDLRRFALGHVYLVALRGKGVVSLDRAVAFVRARARRPHLRRSRIEAVLRDLAAEFDAPISVECGGLFFGFRNVKRQFLASELVRSKIDLIRAATGRIVFDSGDSPAEARLRDLEIFDAELARASGAGAFDSQRH